jgi:hypothetical protein
MPFLRQIFQQENSYARGIFATQFLLDLVLRAGKRAGSWTHDVSERRVCPPRSVTKVDVVSNKLDEVTVCEWSGAVSE